VRTNRFLLGALAAAAIVVAACGSGTAATAAPVATNLPAPTTNPDAATLTSGTWDLNLLGTDESIKLDGLSPTINFAADGTVSGTAACNSFTGTYTVSGDALTIKQGAMTQMACPTEIGTKFETAYMNALTQVRAYIIDLKDGVNTLTLGNESGKTVLRYTLSDAALTGVVWNATGVNNGKQALVSVAAGSTITMELNDKGEVTGNATCNTYNGTYTIDGASITFGPLMSTKMACPSDELNAQEQAYLTALANTRTFELANGVLTFRDADGAMQATYAAK
jgi:heat shock protein HslJ